MSKRVVEGAHPPSILLLGGGGATTTMMMEEEDEGLLLRNVRGAIQAGDGEALVGVLQRRRSAIFQPTKELRAEETRMLAAHAQMMAEHARVRNTQKSDTLAFVNYTRQWIAECIVEKQFESLAAIMHFWDTHSSTEETTRSLLYDPMPTRRGLNLRLLTLMHSSEPYTTHFLLSLLGNVRQPEEEERSWKRREGGAVAEEPIIIIEEEGVFTVKGSTTSSSRVLGDLEDLHHPMRRNILDARSDMDRERLSAMAYAQACIVSPHILSYCVRWLRLRESERTSSSSSSSSRHPRRRHQI